jgi:hypothetical protein
VVVNVPRVMRLCSECDEIKGLFAVQYAKLLSEKQRPGVALKNGSSEAKFISTADSFSDKLSASPEATPFYAA